MPALLAELSSADIDILGFHVFAGSQNLRAEIIAEAQRRTVDLVLELAEHLPTPVPLPQPRRRVRHPVLRPGRTARPGAWWPTTSTTLVDGRARRAAARGQAGDRARPLHRRRVRGLRDRGRRPQGLPRPDLSRRRRRHAPPARRLRQLRPGHPAQLPGRRRHPASTSRSSTPPRSSAACARRSTCSATRSSSRRPTSATSSCSSRPARTASPPAPPPSSGTRLRPRSSSSPPRHERNHHDHRYRHPERGQVRARHDAGDRGPRRVASTPRPSCSAASPNSTRSPCSSW